MRRVFCFTRTLCLILLVSAGILIVIGRQQPTPQRLTMLHLADCTLPCWIGIMPGQTTIEQAQQRLEAVYGSSPQYQLVFDTSSANKFVVVLGTQAPPTFILITIHARPDSIIESVLLQLDFLRRDGADGALSPDNRVTIGDLYTVFGSPSRAVLSQDTQQPHSTVVMVYDKPDGGAMTFASSRAEPNWKLPATSIFLYADKYAFLGTVGTFRPWHGFASLDRYAVQLP